MTILLIFSLLILYSIISGPFSNPSLLSWGTCGSWFWASLRQIANCTHKHLGPRSQLSEGPLIHSLLQLQGLGSSFVHPKSWQRLNQGILSKQAAISKNFCALLKCWILWKSSEKNEKSTCTKASICLEKQNIPGLSHLWPLELGKLCLTVGVILLCLIPILSGS